MFRTLLLRIYLFQTQPLPGSLKLYCKLFYIFALPFNIIVAMVIRNVHESSLIFTLPLFVVGKHPPL